MYLSSCWADFLGAETELVCLSSFWGCCRDAVYAAAAVVVAVAVDCPSGIYYCCCYLR